MKNRGFLLIDSLITVVIVSAMSLLCISIFTSLDKYEEGYENYKNENSNQINEIYDELGVCEKCVFIEDSSPLEQY